MIQVKSLTKFYGQFQAVSDLSFEVLPGDILGLVGPNGAGKTTTLRSLVGIIAPSGGSIHIGGHDLARNSVEAKRLLAFIPDEPKLFEHLTVEEHLTFIGRLYGVTDTRERIPMLLSELELEQRRHAVPEELSRGMRQKLAIACGLLYNPRVLIFDEPLTGLDPGAIRRLKNLIRTRSAEGAAIILSSHLLHLVEELCTHLLLIQRGRSVVQGSMEEIRAGLPEMQGRGLEELFLALTQQSEGIDAE